jgi:hypothetical protein
LWLGAIVVLALIGGGIEGSRLWSDRSYIGSTRQTVLDWQCSNAIFWPQAASGRRWWAGDNPVVTGHVATSSSTPTHDLPLYHASGRLHFDSYNVATFTSDSGGKMILHRQHGRPFAAADCRLGPL